MHTFGKLPHIGSCEIVLSAKLDVPNREVLVEVNVAAIRTLAMNFAPPDAREQIGGVLSELGIDGITSFGYALGFEDGGTRAAVHLGMRDGASGALSAVSKILPTVSGVLSVPTSRNE